MTELALFRPPLALPLSALAFTPASAEMPPAAIVEAPATVTVLSIRSSRQEPEAVEVRPREPVDAGRQELEAVEDGQPEPEPVEVRRREAVEDGRQVIEAIGAGRQVIEAIDVSRKPRGAVEVRRREAKWLSGGWLYIPRLVKPRNCWRCK